jgi:hypothetical protein
MAQHQSLRATRLRAAPRVPRGKLATKVKKLNIEYCWWAFGRMGPAPEPESHPSSRCACYAEAGGAGYKFGGVLNIGSSLKSQVSSPKSQVPSIHDLSLGT